MEKLINIVCVHWEGDFRNRNYKISDVIRLKKMVSRNIKTPFKFYCLTNKIQKDVDYEQIPLRYNLEGWWSKLELFRSDLPIKGKILYLDLDIFINGGLDEIAFYGINNGKHPIYFMKPIGPNLIYGARKSNNIIDIGKTIVGNFQSSVISWNQGYPTLSVPQLINDGVQYKYRGDQDLFGVLFDDMAGTFPAMWFNKIRYCYTGGPDKRVKVVLGNPKYLYQKALNIKPSWVRRIIL